MTAPATQGTGGATAAAARVGLLVPSSNTAVEADLRTLTPTDVSLHSARMWMVDASVAAVRALVDTYASAAARDLATVRPHVSLFCCTSAGAILGADAERELTLRLRDVLGCPLITAHEATSDAIRSYAPSSIAIVTPYVDEETAQLAAAKEAEGYRVVRAVGMRLTSNFDIGQVTVPRLCAFAQSQLAGLEFDLLFVACTNLRTAGALRPLAERYGLPVVTSNSALADAALRVLRESDGSERTAGDIL